MRLPIADDRAAAGGFDFDAALARAGLGALTAEAVSTLQINVGKRCNQACHHCHVEAGPKRTEMMTEDTAARLIALLDRSPDVTLVDITGGAPELNPNFRALVTAARERGRDVIDRCNLTILHEPGQEDLAEFLAGHGVRVTASLPCYSAANVEKQRGKGVFEASIRGLQRLNALGYGQPDSGLVLDLVYNPVGAFLPPPQAALEADYKRRLFDDFGVVFGSLFTITNMPISRFAHALARDGAHDEYMSLLVNHFNPGTVADLMCRSQISVGWDGVLYDCDFNQMLEIAIGDTAGDAGDSPSDATSRPTSRPTIWDIESLSELTGRAIATASHCFGCTAGAGSSCGGALA